MQISVAADAFDEPGDIGSAQQEAQDGGRVG
jgi:hypothetical protein